ncbi:MAG: fibronectin type III domain-containing protein [Candidatus Diapherotrites archaeon]|nr:fibronectin type III domain-containing protein [Candidatus Diapherotrites archaeon]
MGLKWISLIVLLIFGISFSLAAPLAWTGSGLDFNNFPGNTARSISGFQVTTINFTPEEGNPLSAVCFNSTDTASGSSCTDSNTTPIIMTSAFFSSSSDGNHIIYAFLKSLDGNYSVSSSEHIKIDSTGPTYTAYPVSGADYNLTSLVVDFNFSDASTPITSAIIFDGVAINDGDTLSSLIEGTHTMVIDANDSLGNNKHDSYTFKVDTTAPYNGSITSTYAASWTNNTGPSFTSATASDAVSGVTSGKVAFSCSSTGPWYEASIAATISDFNIVSTTYGCNNNDGNKTIYIKFRDNAGNWMPDSNAISRNVSLDRVAPSAPTNLGISTNNSAITLSWTAPSADNASGNYYVQVYKGGAYLADVNATSTSYESTGLTNGTTYTYKIRTKDSAGNYSDFTSEISGIPQSTNATISINKGTNTANYAKNGDVLAVVCNYSSSATGAKIKYAYYNPNTSSGELATSSSSTTSLSQNFTVNVSTNNEKVGFWCEASGSAGTNVSYVIIDNTSPRINVIDNKLIDKVEFEFKSVLYGAVKENSVSAGYNYYFDLNTLQFDSTSYELKANVFDKAGNKTSITRTITIENILTPLQTATKAISLAENIKPTADGILVTFAKAGLKLPDLLSSKKSSADALLSGAKAELNASPVSASDKANNALTLYNEFIATAKIEEKETKNYLYDGNILVSDLIKAGIKQNDAPILAQRIISSGIQRQIVLVSAGSSDKLQFEIRITFKNDTNDNIVKIVETIPKELLISAKNIITDANYRVLLEDPVIEFSVPVVKGASATIIYGVGELNSLDANKLMEEGVIVAFTTPPLIIEQLETSENIVPLPAFGEITLVVIIVVIILIILIIVGFIIIKGRSKGNEFGKGKSIVDHLTSEPKQEKKMWGQK